MDDMVATAPGHAADRAFRDDDDLVSAPEFRRSLGNISAMTEWRWSRAIPGFPRAIRINGRKYYRVGDGRRFIASRAGEIV